MNGAEVLVLAGCLEFEGKPFVGVKRRRGERTVYFGNLMWLLVLVDPSYLRATRYCQISGPKHKVLYSDCGGARAGHARSWLCPPNSRCGEARGTARPRTRSLIFTLLVCVMGPAFGDSEGRQIDRAHSTITVYVYKTGILSTLAHNHEIEAPIESGEVKGSDNSSAEPLVVVGRNFGQRRDQGGVFDRNSKISHSTETLAAHHKTRQVPGTWDVSVQFLS